MKQTLRNLQKLCYRMIDLLSTLTPYAKILFFALNPLFTLLILNPFIQ